MFLTFIDLYIPTINFEALLREILVIKLIERWNEIRYSTAGLRVVFLVFLPPFCLFSKLKLTTTEDLNLNRGEELYMRI